MQSKYSSVVKLAVKSYARHLSSLSSSTPPSKLFSTTSSSRSPNPKTARTIQSIASFNLLKEIRASRPAVRYTVYAGLTLMATVESTFWFNVLSAKFFPSKSEEDKQKADVFLERVRGAVNGSRAAWLGNYGRYFGGYV
jgi:hypothetical protein